MKFSKSVWNSSYLGDLVFETRVNRGGAPEPANSPWNSIESISAVSVKFRTFRECKFLEEKLGALKAFDFRCAQGPPFVYRYGYSFLLYVSGFITTEFAGTTAIFLHISWQQLEYARESCKRKYPNVSLKQAPPNQGLDPFFLFFLFFIAMMQLSKCSCTELNRAGGLKYISWQGVPAGQSREKRSLERSLIPPAGVDGISWIRKRQRLSESKVSPFLKLDRPP